MLKTDDTMFLVLNFNQNPTSVKTFPGGWFIGMLVALKITMSITVLLTLRTLLHNVLTETTCGTPIIFFAVNTLRNTGIFFNTKM